MIKWEKGIVEDLLDDKECKQLDRECEIMRRQMELVQKGIKKFGWSLSNQEWRKFFSQLFLPYSSEVFSKILFRRGFHNQLNIEYKNL